MTYAAMKLNDSQILDVLLAARKLGVTVMCHCENNDMCVAASLYPCCVSFPDFSLFDLFQHRVDVQQVDGGWYDRALVRSLRLKSSEGHFH